MAMSGGEDLDSHLASLSSVLPEEDLDTARLIISKLGQKGADRTNPATVSDIQSWFAPDLSETDIKRIIGVLITSDSVPVSGDVSTDSIYLEPEYFSKPEVSLDMPDTSHDADSSDGDDKEEYRDSDELKARIVHKLLRRQVIGSHKKLVSTVAAWFPPHEQGEVKRLIRELATDPNSPVEYYGGGHRDQIRLTGYEDAKSYIENTSGQTNISLF
jgi:hypothetical protein